VLRRTFKNVAKLENSVQCDIVKDTQFNEEWQRQGGSGTVG
jgi:hypothetical protein